jgi:hypothetical protein
MSKTDGGRHSRFQMGRRDFLFLSSAAALGVAASGFGSEVARTIGFTGATRPFALGYTAAVLPKTPTGVHELIDASRLTTSSFDKDLARVTVHGFWSSKARSAAVAAYFDADGKDVPFLAWAHVSRGNALAPRTSFRAPVRADGSLVLGFESRDPLPVPTNLLTRRLRDVRTHLAGANADALIAAAADAEAPARCALGRDVKLRRGTYVVAFRDRISDPKPNWRALQLAFAEPTPLVHSGILGASAAPFDYLVLTIDHA